MDHLWRAVNRGHKRQIDPREGWPATCLPTASGAWAIVHSDIKYTPGTWPPRCQEDQDPYDDAYTSEAVTGVWSLSYLTPDGRQISAKPGSPWRGSFGDNLGGNGIRIALLTDYNEDGVAEVMVTRWAAGEGYSDEETSYVLTVKGDAVDYYPQVENLVIDAVEDVDHDGRPDLWTYATFAKEYWTGNGDGLLHGPRFLLLAQPGGTFVYDHKLGRAALADQCAESSAPLVACSDGRVDIEETALNIACARLYSTPTKRLVKAIQRGCEGSKKHDFDSDSVVLKPVLLGWAALAAPVRLKR